MENLTYLKIGVRDIRNQKHPINLGVGDYELLAKSTYLFKEFTIRKNVKITEDELTTIFINENEIKFEKEKHLKFVKYSSGTAFLFWLVLALLPYDM